MNKVIELENALTGLFRKGTEVGYSETEINEFLAKIDYDILLATTLYLISFLV